MEASKEIDALLRSDGAVLIRQGKHLVYKLSNGLTWSRPKTPSDHRSNHNSLSDLKKLLPYNSIEKAKDEEQPTLLETVLETPEDIPQEEVLQQEEEEQQEPQNNTVLSKIQAEIDKLSVLRDEHMAIATDLDDRIRTFQRVKDLSLTEKDFELLIGVLAKQPRSYNKPAVKPQKQQAKVASPDFIGNHIEVTAELVWATCQTFTGEFTINDITKTMIGNKKISTIEFARVRNSIGQAMQRFTSRGELHCVKKKSILSGRPTNLYSRVDVAQLRK